MPQPHVVRSLLETDLYKFTMWQALLHGHPGAHAEYEFACRNTPQFPLADLAAEVDAELDHLCSLSFTESELAYLRGLRFIKSDFVDFLTVFRFQRKFITVTTEGETLRIHAAGPQVHVMGFEIFVLYIVNELYFRRFDRDAAMAQGRARLAEKIRLLKAFRQEPTRRNPFEFSDFGLRRRFSSPWHDEVVDTLLAQVPEFFKGTSNVAIARRIGMVPIGTMAHEYLQSFQAFGVRLRDFQKAALEDWVQEYRGDLGIALTDVVGMDAFLGDFDLYFAKLFDNRELQLLTANRELNKPWTHALVQGNVGKVEEAVVWFSKGINLRVHDRLNKGCKCVFRYVRLLSKRGLSLIPVTAMASVC